MNGFRTRRRPTRRERRASRIQGDGARRAISWAREAMSPRTLFSFGPTILAALALIVVLAIPMGSLFGLGWWYGEVNPLTIYGPDLVGEWQGRRQDCLTDAGCDFESGSAHRLTIASPSVPATSAMTIRAHLRPESIGSAMDFVGKWDAAFVFLARIQPGGKLQLFINGVSSHGVGSTVLVAGTPYEAVLVYDGTQANADRIKIYVDGVLETMVITGTIPTSLSTASSRMDVGFGGGFYDGIIQCLGLSASALSGAALTAAHTATFYDNMSAARQADWFSFYNLPEVSGVRADSTGLNDLSAVNAPGVAQGVATGPVQDRAPRKQWTDRRNGKPFVSPDLAGSAIWYESLLNGKPGATYDGVDDYETYNAGAAQFSGDDKPWTVGVVVKKASNAANHTLFALAETGAGTGFHLIQTDAAPNYSVQRRDDAAVSVTRSAGTPDISVHVLVVSFSGTGIVVYLDGTELTSSLSHDVGLATLNSLSLGAFVRASVTNFLPCDMPHFVLAKRGSTVPEIVRLSKYLAAPYGIAV